MGGERGVRRLCRFLVDSPKGMQRRVHFVWISSLENWVKKKLYFEQWLSLFICLFINYYYYYYFGWH